jgi:phospholipase/carboxylesterase
VRLTRRALLGLAGATLLAGCGIDPRRETRLAARPTAAARIPGAGLQTLMLAPRGTYLYVPPTAQAPAPFIVWLHGAGGNGRDIERLRPSADDLGAIVLSVTSRGPTWDVVTGRASGDFASLNQALDIAFISCSIDPRRVALAGFSDGASAALSWGLPNGDLFTGVAAFSPGMLRIWGPAQGRPRIFVAHGTHDPVFPIDRSGRPVADTLRRAGYAVELREFDAGHTVPADVLRAGLQQILAPT